MNEVSIAIDLLGYVKKDLSLAEAVNVLNLITNDGQLKVSPELLKDLANRVLADTPGLVVWHFWNLVYLCPAMRPEKRSTGFKKVRNKLTTSSRLTVFAEL